MSAKEILTIATQMHNVKILLDHSNALASLDTQGQDRNAVVCISSDIHSKKRGFLSIICRNYVIWVRFNWGKHDNLITRMISMETVWKQCG